MNSASENRAAELARLFLKLGIVGFGGPAAHIALMEDEVVNRRQWLGRSQFLDLIGATNLIPGPNSTEMAIHVGYVYGGVPGLLVAGTCFILPAVLLTGILAWIYQTWGTVPAAAPLLYGIKPAVLAIIAGALWRLGGKAIKNRRLLATAAGVVGLALAGVNEVLSLLLGGVLGAICLTLMPPANSSLPVLVAVGGMGTAIQAGATVTPSLAQLSGFFLKVGSVLFGSGYLLVAFLEGEVVEKYGWLTQQQLLDAIAIGQLTPGPVLSTATFIGYLILGLPGAIAATVSIFLPSFIFVVASNPLIPKLRQSPWTGAFLDAVNASAVALMAVVTLRLAAAVLLQPRGSLPIDLAAGAIAALAALSVLRWRVNAAWVILASSAIGWVLQPLLGPI